MILVILIISLSMIPIYGRVFKQFIAHTTSNIIREAENILKGEKYD